MVPRMFAICSYREEYKMFFKNDSLVIFLGEIPNMPGHCVVAGCTTGKIYSGLHTDNFVEMQEDEL